MEVTEKKRERRGENMWERKSERNKVKEKGLKKNYGRKRTVSSLNLSFMDQFQTIKKICVLYQIKWIE